MRVIIEIKGTGWDKIPAVRVRRNLRRHLRQLQAYPGTAAEEMDAGRWPGSILRHVTTAGPYMGSQRLSRWP